MIVFTRHWARTAVTLILLVFALLHAGEPDKGCAGERQRAIAIFSLLQSIPELALATEEEKVKVSLKGLQGARSGHLQTAAA